MTYAEDAERGTSATGCFRIAMVRLAGLRRAVSGC